MDMERQLVTIRVVAEIRPILNADNIELAIVDGWQCVVKKGEFKVGDRGIYFEIDSFIPVGNPAFEFLRKDAREWKGKLGIRIRTIKLRGQISQGLLLSKSSVPSPLPLKKGEYLDNLAKHFGVVKWEREEPVQEVRYDSWFDSVIRFFTPKKYRPAVFAFIYTKFFKRKGVRGLSSFPSFIPKTDQERIQNVINKKLDCIDEYRVTVKMNGSSMTVYVNNGVFGHCSKNVKLGVEDGSRFSEIVKRYDMNILLPRIIGKDGRNLAIQGELCGPGIQGNYEGLETMEFFVFDIWDIDKQHYLPPYDKDSILEALKSNGLELKKVPHIATVHINSFKSINDYLTFAEGPSLIVKKREGVVFQRLDGGDSFKVVSNSYLLKGGD